MQFVDIEKEDGGAFLHRYDLHYIDRTGCPRTYEMVSRDRNIDSLEHLQHHRTDAVVMVLTDAARASTSHSSTSFAWSLASAFTTARRPHRAGETPDQAARRELREETGLRLTAITHVLPPAACTVGIGDERTVCVFGTAEGTFRPEHRPHGGRSSGVEAHARAGARPARDGPVRFLGAGLQLDVRKRLPAGHLKAHIHDYGAIIMRFIRKFISRASPILTAAAKLGYEAILRIF
ncbi:MAG: NUDIX domain-containing protein [Oscillospiraceae bacterium]